MKVKILAEIILEVDGLEKPSDIIIDEDFVSDTRADFYLFNSKEEDGENTLTIDSYKIVSAMDLDILRYSFLVGIGARTPEEDKEMKELHEKLVNEGRDPGWK